MPQREINACLFHSERKQKSEEMGPPRDMESRGLSGPAPNGVRRWITSFAEGETGAQLGPPQLKQVRLPSGGLCLQQRSLANHCGVLLHSNPLQKHLCRESWDRDKGPDGNGGWVQNYQRAGCGLGLTSRQSKPPVLQGPPFVPWVPKGPEGNMGSGELGL